MEPTLRSSADEINGQLQWIINEALRKAKRLPKKKKGTNNGETDV
ncbi:MAG: DNA-binding protein [Prevotella sp.]|nr:DNA-binding protein [Prevotella sp.]